MSDDKPDNVVKLGLVKPPKVPPSPIESEADTIPLEFFESDDVASVVMMALRMLRATGKEINIKVDFFGIEVSATQLGDYQSLESCDTDVHTTHAAQMTLLEPDDEVISIEEMTNRFRQCLKAALLPYRSQQFTSSEDTDERET